MKLKSLLLIIISQFIIQCKSNYIDSCQLPVKNVVDTLFGRKIVDNYRYIENINDSIAINWYKAQTKYANKLLSKITNRNKIIQLQRDLDLQNSNKTSSLKITTNDLYFYLKKNSPGINENLYYKNSIDGDEKLLLDINAYKKDHTINYINPNWDGSKVVVGITKNDLEIGDIIILDVNSKTIVDEPIHNCWPSALGGIRWLPDNSGFTYEYIPEINKNSKDYLLNVKTLLHLIGNKPVLDKVLFSKMNNPNINIKDEDFPEVSFVDINSKYMFASISGASFYADYYYCDLKDIFNKSINWKKLFNKENLIKDFYIDGNDIIFLTSKNAENFKICKTSLLNPDFETPEILINEDSSLVISDFALTSKGLFFVKTKNGVDAKLYKIDSNNVISNILIPKKSGSINVTSKSSDSSDLWLELTGWTFQKTRYKFDHNKKEFVSNDLYPKSGYNELLKNVIIEEIEIESHDGEKVPLSIIYKKHTKLNSSNLAFISCYGSFGISFKPALNSYLLHWVMNGGIYAVAHVRGGGEKGNSWYQAGYKETKPNSWKDLIACTEYLIDNKYTNKESTAIYSASGGGITIGRAITERPDLFSTALIRVGIFNTLRSEFAPNGKNLSNEFGTVKDSLEFNYLLEMDSYHKIKKDIEYPAVYLTAGMNDSRVVVWQPGKFAGKLQAMSASKKPILLSVDFNGGHGYDSTGNTKNEELVNLLSFALWQMGHPDYQLKE